MDRPYFITADCVLSSISIELYYVKPCNDYKYASMSSALKNTIKEAIVYVRD